MTATQTAMDPAGETDGQRTAQERQYAIPYHYLPVVSDGYFQQHLFWSWGYRYLGRMQVAGDLLAEEDFDSLLDVGCGDGRFVAEAAARFAPRRLLGIDISERAVDLARRMNPDLAFEMCHVTQVPTTSTWDAVTLLEVIEHIPPSALPGFLESVAGLLRPGGRLVLTAPGHRQSRPEKHHQHFDIEGLRRLLPPDMVALRTFEFDAPSRMLRTVAKLMGGAGTHFIVTNRRLNDWLLRHYLKNCLVGDRLRNPQRIACVARREAV